MEIIIKSTLIIVWLILLFLRCYCISHTEASIKKAVVKKHVASTPLRLRRQSTCYHINVLISNSSKDIKGHVEYKLMMILYVFCVKIINSNHGSNYTLLASLIGFYSSGLKSFTWYLDLLIFIHLISDWLFLAIVKITLTFFYLWRICYLLVKWKRR